MDRKPTTASLIRKHGYTTYKPAKHGRMEIINPDTGKAFKPYDRIPNNLWSQALKDRIRRLRSWMNRG